MCTTGSGGQTLSQNGERRQLVPHFRVRRIPFGLVLLRLCDGLSEVVQDGRPRFHTDEWKDEVFDVLEHGEDVFFLMFVQLVSFTVRCGWNFEEFSYWKFEFSFCDLVCEIADVMILPNYFHAYEYD